MNSGIYIRVGKENVLLEQMEDEEMERIKNILSVGGVRHYLLKIYDNEELDVVEYKEYQKLEQENQQLYNKMDKAIKTIESWHFALDWAENDRLQIIKEILKGDVDE